MTAVVSEAIDVVRGVLDRAGDSIVVGGRPGPALRGDLIETFDPATGADEGATPVCGGARPDGEPARGDFLTPRPSRWGGLD